MEVAVESTEFHGNLRDGLDRKQYVVLIIKIGDLYIVKLKC